MIIRPVKAVTEAANMIARGEKGAVLKGDDYVGEMGLLFESFRGMEMFNNQQTEWLTSIAEGDLSVDVRPRGENDYLGHAIVSMLAKLNEMFANINRSAHQVAAGSKQIAGGAQSLAQGSSAQTIAIDALSMSMFDIAENARRNAEIANEAANLSFEIRKNAEKGTMQMNRMMESVKEINESGSTIRNVIKTIDNIAFQTNILALNAAVEAARAGEQGKGFAVVAEEVRTLASRSQTAVGETAELIEESINRVVEGTKTANETAEALRTIVNDVSKVAEIITDIAAASGEQASAIGQITEGLSQITDVAQNNSATSEESASASQQLSGQAETLNNLVSVFRMKR